MLQDQKQDPESEKARVLEERRAQRQARLAQLARDSNLEPAVQAESHTSTFSMPIQGGRSQERSEVLVIDPRNRGNDQ